jgi:hypothetical protein
MPPLRPAADLIGIVRLLSDEVERAGHGLKQIVEIVGDAAGELTDRLHLLGLEERRLGALALDYLELQLGKGVVALADALAELGIGLLELQRRGEGLAPSG